MQCFDLVDKDWLSKSDPIVVVQEKKRPEDQWTLIGRTEMIKDNQNPEFKQKVILVMSLDFLKLVATVLERAASGKR